MIAFAQIPLAEVCTVVGGGTPRRSNAAYFDGTIPWATPTDVTALDSLFIARTKETITEDGLNESSARLVPAETVLMTSRATIGYTAIASQPMATNQGFANLICSEQIVPEYLAYWLRSQRERLIQLAGGTTFKEIPKSTLKKVRIPLPPLAEQRRIVNILNRAAKIEQLRKQAQERLREFIPALFVKMFGDPVENPMGWEIKPLKDLLTLHDSGVWGPEDQSDGISVLRSTNFKPDGSVRFGNLTYRHIDSDKRRNKILLPNDIILEKSGGGPKQPVGRVCLFRGHQIEHTFGNFTARLRADRSIVDPEYLFQVLRNFHLSGGTLQYQKHTSGIRNLETNRYLSHSIPLPPIHNQKRFAKIIQSAQSTTKLADSGHKNTASLTASLMSRLLGAGT